MEKEHQHNSLPEMFQGANLEVCHPSPDVFLFFFFFSNLKMDKGKQAAFQNKAFGT